MSDASRERFRAQMLARVPRWYSPTAHICITVGLGIAAAIVGISRVDGLHPAEILAVPATLLFANFFEWFLHREVLHRPRLGGLIYGKHTLEHHRLYRQDSMEIRDRREFPYVLLGPTTFSVIVISAALVAAVPGLVFGANVGWLVLAAESLYVTCYEILHLSYHLPPEHPVGRLGIIRRLGGHHARHHDPRLMRRWNLNVSIPLADWVLGTVAPRGPETSPAPPTEPEFDD